MAVSRNTTTPWDGTAGDAPFRAWVQAIEAALVAAGCVVVADSGDIDPTTVTFPAAEGSAGYRIYAFADAEQATNPIYFKITYERGDAATELRLGFQVGKGSNGAGTLSNATAAATSTTAGDVDSANRLIHASLIDGELLLVASANQTGTGGFGLVIARGRDRAGAFDGKIFAAGVLAATTGFNHVWTGGAWVATGAFWAPPGGDLADGAYPLATLWVNGWPRPLKVLSAILATAVAQGDSGSAEIDGETVALIALGAASGGAGIINFGPPTNGHGAIVGSGVTATGAARLLLRNE